MSDLNEAATDVHEPHLLRFGGLLANYSSDKKHRFRAMLAVKQGMKCCYCCKPVTLQFPSKKKVHLDFATFEHLEDVFSGNGPKNDSTSAVAIACRQCNENRGRMRSKWAFQYYGSLLHQVNHPAEIPATSQGWLGCHCPRIRASATARFEFYPKRFAEVNYERVLQNNCVQPAKS